MRHDFSPVTHKNEVFKKEKVKQKMVKKREKIPLFFQREILSELHYEIVVQTKHH
jgi:hypothetical protein